MPVNLALPRNMRANLPISGVIPDAFAAVRPNDVCAIGSAARAVVGQFAFIDVFALPALTLVSFFAWTLIAARRVLAHL